MLSKLIVSDLWFSAEFMHLCIFNHWLTWTWTVCICILHLSVRNFLVLIGKDDSLTLSLYPLFVADGIFQEFFFFVPQDVLSNPLDVWQNIEDTSLFVVLPCVCIMSLTFLEVVPKWSGECSGTFVWLGLRKHSNLLSVSFLSLGYIIHLVAIGW